VVEPHDRFILRALSPVATVGGGEVLLAGARHWHEHARHAAFLAALRDADAPAAVLALAADGGRAGVVAADLAAAGLGAGEAAAALAAAEDAGELEALRPTDAASPAAGVPLRWFVAGTLAALRAELLAGVSARATARPERPFSSAAELGAAVSALPVRDVDMLLQRMVADAELVAGEGGYAPAGAGVLGDEQAALAGVILERLTADPLAPPTLATLAEESRRPAREVAQILDVLARRGDVVRVDRDLWFAKSAVDDARAILLAQLEGAGEVTLAGFRDAAGCGRRNAQALLECFDREGLTLRRGDVRVARRRRD
jgi:selenocysteine-specific elongation factor